MFFGLVNSSFIGFIAASELSASEELKKVLEEAKQDKKAFITRISKGLKQCTNGKMLKLDHLMVKSSYWWDENPYKMTSIGKDIQYPKINLSKLLIIDRKERSSVYDREFPFVPWGQDVYQLLTKFNLSSRNFVNDWASAAQKISLFTDKKIGENKTPPELKGIVDYGFPYNEHLDTYPSIYQMLDVLKTLKYESKKLTSESPEPTSCPMELKNIRSQTPSEVIIEQLNDLFQKPYYQSFKAQNHPLNKIMQDHLKKIHYMASNGQIKGDPSAEDKGYNSSVMYSKMLHYIDYIIFLLSAFDIDMDRKICTITGSNEWADIPVKDAYYLYVQFYEVINDLLFLLMSLEDPYNTEQFDRILSTSYTSRFPVVNELYHDENIRMSSYPARSGMDAFDGSCLAIEYVPQGISIAPKVANLENTMYYEISSLIRQFPHRGEERSLLLVGTDNKEIINLVRQAVLEIYIDTVIKKSIKARWGKKVSLNEYLEKIVTSFNEREMYDGKAVQVDYGDEEDFLIEKRVYQEIIKNIDMESFMPATFMGGKSTIEIPTFIASQRNFYEDVLSKYKEILYDNSENLDDEKYKDVIETHLEFDQHYSMSSGMTTDTVDLSNDPNYIDRLKEKIALIRQIKQQWQPTNDPFVILWDTTMEIDQGPVYKLIEHYKPQIQNGEIVFILFKSLQKYANLGIGKSKAGAITLIGKKIPFVQAIHEKLLSYGNAVFKRSQDYAFMTFTYDRLNEPTFQDNEVLYYQAVRKQAQEAYKERYSNLGYMISGGCLFFRESSCSGLYADTFGFAVPTQTHIENGLCRYSVGLNPKGF